MATLTQAKKLQEKIQKLIEAANDIPGADNVVHSLNTAWAQAYDIVTKENLRANGEYFMAKVSTPMGEQIVIIISELGEEFIKNDAYQASALFAKCSTQDVKVKETRKVSKSIIESAQPVQNCYLGSGEDKLQWAWVL